MKKDIPLATFGQPGPAPGKENVFKLVLEALKHIRLQGLFGNTVEEVDRLIKMLTEREAHGVEKYGRSLETWNGRDALQDVLEEELDRFVYLTQARREHADVIETNMRLLAEVQLLNQRAVESSNVETALRRQLEEARNHIAALKHTSQTDRAEAYEDGRARGQHEMRGAQHAPPPNAMGAAAESAVGAVTAPQDPLLQAPTHVRAYRDTLCKTGLLPANRVPDTRDVIRDLFLACYANSALHGFWGQDAETAIHNSQITGKAFEVIPEKLCLMHSELSEALEAYRDLGKHENDNSPFMPIQAWLLWFTKEGKPEGFLSELADTVIRIGDLVGSMSLERHFVDAMLRKMEYNSKRPHKHGKTC